MSADAWAAVQFFLAASAAILIARFDFAVTGRVSAIAWGVLIRRVSFYGCHNLLLGKIGNNQIFNSAFYATVNLISETL
jgi:hypothetical protein